MNKILNEKIKQAREDLRIFLKGTEKKLDIAIDCPVEYRIRFIYSIIFPGLKKLMFYWRFFISRIAGIVDYSPIKVILYRSIGMKIGKGVFISPGVVLDPHFPGLIDIGEYTIIGWGTCLFTHNFLSGKYSVGRIQIGRGVVIGAFSLISGGVIIGENTQIAAACIVYKDVSQNDSINSGILLNRALAGANRRENAADS